MNTYVFELKALKPWSWFISVAGVIVAAMSMYPMIAGDAGDFERLLNNMPPAILAIINIQAVSFSNVLVFFGLVLNYIKIIAGIQAMLWSALVMTKERRFHTADFLMSKPRARARILTGKAAAAATGLAGTSLVFLLMSAIMLAVHGDGYNGWHFFLIFLGFAGFQLVFASIGLFVGTAFQKIKNPLGICLGTVFGTYIAGALGGLSDDNKFKLLSPFEYFSANDIFMNGHYGAGYVVLGLAIAAACISGSYYVFSRQDIR